MRYPKAIQNLIDAFARLPSVGPKTAERYVFYLLNRESEELQRLAQAIAELKEKTVTCRICLRVAEADPCSICADSKRDRTKLCLVASTRDLLAIEATGVYHGQYHVLGGLIDAIHDIKPEKLTILALQEKLKQGSFTELILALNPTVEGETTVLYLAKLLRGSGIKLSRLARGLPTGADIEYADEMTLANALEFRNQA